MKKCKSEIFQKSFPNFVPLYGVVIWRKFQLIGTKIDGADMFNVISKCHFL